MNSETNAEVSLFRGSYKPDILQCLANLSNDEVFTPPEVANKMLDLLPPEIWSDPNIKFLDPACKTGVFLREITKRLIVGLEKKIPDLQKRIDHISQNMVYGIAITEITGLISRRTLYCSKNANSIFSISEFETPQGNVIFKPQKHNWENGKCTFCGASQEEYDREDGLESHAYQFIHTLNPEEIFNMKFDVIVGNPPYQMSDGGNGASAKPLYHLFVEQAKKLNPRYITMIIPSRWYSGGKGLDEFRAKMLDSKIKELHDFTNPAECFPGVEIKGGVCYFLWDSNNDKLPTIINHNGDTCSSMVRPLKEVGCDTFVRYNDAISILRKIKDRNEETIASFVSARKPFGFATSFRDYSKSPKGNAILIYVNSGIGYVNRSLIKKGKSSIGKYKVLMTKAYGAGDSFPHQILNTPILAEPDTCCTETYIILNEFETIEYAKNYISYLKTKFFRFLVLLKKSTQDATSKVYQFVPIQDFSKPWTDEELYKKYKLTKEEIDFIESMIRPME